MLPFDAWIFYNLVTDFKDVSIPFVELRNTKESGGKRKDSYNQKPDERQDLVRDCLDHLHQIGCRLEDRKDGNNFVPNEQLRDRLYNPKGVVHNFFIQDVLCLTNRELLFFYLNFSQDQSHAIYDD